MTTNDPGPRPLEADEQAAWAAVRTRLLIAHPWLTEAIFRAVPAALAPGATIEAAAASDRWGRIYLDFTLEQRAGLPALADHARDAVMAWLSDQNTHAPWHATRLDDRFPAVGAADTAHAARTAASALAGQRPPTFGDDPFGPFRDWARNLSGPPQVPWQDVLGARVRSALTTAAGWHQRTYARPGRRQVPGVITPSYRSPQLSVAVIADISGSLAPDLPTVVTEVAGICGTAGVDASHLTLLAVDDEVADVLRPIPDLLVLAPRAGHLTDLRPGFTAAADARADVIVVLTDGITPWPDTPPHAPTIVVLIGERTVREQGADSAPTWATVLHLDTTDLGPNTAAAP